MTAGIYNTTIDQGSVWSVVLVYTDSNNVPVNLTGYTASMQLRQNYNSTTADLTLTTANGGITYVGSVFLKKAVGSPDWMQVAYSTTGLGGFANFNLTSGTVGNVGAGCTGRIENYGNGWYRCTLVQTASVGGTSGGPVIVFTNNTNPTVRYVSYLGSVATSIYAWGAQLETGSVATSYIPTVASGITRAADVITDTTASGVIGQTQGTIYAEVVFSNASAGAIFLLDNGSTSTFLNISRTTGQNVQVSLRNGGGSIATIITSSALANGVHKVALSYTNGAYSLYINGLPAGTSTDSTNYPASLTSASICSLNYGAPYFPRNDRIRAHAIYPTRLPNTGPNSLQSLTQ